MRVVVTTFPGKGHFHPLAPLAGALRDRGHDVVVATGADLIDWVRACGLRAEAAGLTEHEAVAAAQREAPPGAPFGPYMFARTAPEPMLRDLRRLAARWAPDLVVHEEAEYAAPLLAAELGVPCVTHSWPAPALPAAARAAATELLAPLWSRCGLGPARTTGDIYLDCCPPALQTEDIAAVASSVYQVRPELFDGPPPVAALPGLGGLPRPLAYVTFGTAPTFARADSLRVVAAAVAARAASVVVTTGPVAPGELGALPPNVVVAEYLPQRHVLDHADVVASHGGAGSTVGGLVYGVPQLVLPQGAPSQQRLGDRIAQLGAGLRLDRDSQTPANVQEAVERLLGDDAYRRAAARAAAAITAQPHPSTMAEDIERRFR